MKSESTGIYKILNKVTGDFYIGSSARSLKGRWVDHRKNLRGNGHCNNHLQSSWNKHKEESFEFIVLELVDPEKCIFREQHYIDTLKPKYNKSPTAGNCLGVKRSKEVIENHSKKLKEYYKTHSGHFLGKTFTDEHKENLRIAHMGYKAPEEQKKKISESLKKHIKDNNVSMRERACKKIFCITTNQTFESLKAAALFFKLNKCHLSSNINKGKPVKGLLFKYDK